MVLTFPTPELAAAGLVSPRVFLHNRRVEILNISNFDPDTTTLTLRVSRRVDAPVLASVEEVRRDLLARYNLQSFEVLEEDRRRGEFTVLVRQRNSDSLSGILREIDPEVFPVPPCTLEPERTLFGLCGPADALRRTLSLLRRLGLRHEIRSMGPYLFRAGRLLTDRQAKAVALALDLGFFSVPRRTDLRTLGRIMGISPVALGKLLRRAEVRILGDALGEIREM